jgi:hypothetical protein
VSEAGEFAMWLAIGMGQFAFWFAMAPIIKALGNRISGKVPQNEHLSELEERVAALEGRALTSGEVEAQYTRLVEVEERLDFAERMLANKLDTPRPMSEERH